MSAVAEAMDRFIETYIAAGAEPGWRWRRHDPGSPSLCEIGAPTRRGQVRWRPVRQRPAFDLGGLERALELSVHQDLSTYFGRWWSDTLYATFRGEALELVQLWNAADGERLVANQIGHVLQKRRAGEAPTLFIAAGAEEDCLYSVDPASGTVLREQPGRGAVRPVAASLAAFIADLEVGEASSG